MSAKNTFDDFTQKMKTDNPEVTDEQIKEAWDSQSKENLTQQISRMMTEFGEKISLKFQADMETRLQEIVEETNSALVTEIRKGVGLDEDPVVKLSDVKAMVEKMLLEGAVAKGDGHNPEDLEAGRGGGEGDEEKVDMGKDHADLVKARGFPVV